MSSLSILKDRILSICPWMGDVHQIRSMLPFALQNYIDSNMATIPRAINHILILLAVCNTLLFLSACNVYHLPNMGFNTMLISLASSAHVAISWSVFNDQRRSSFTNFKNSQFTVGTVMGTTIGMAMISFVLSIYFGQLSKCEVIEGMIHQYGCDSKGAMWAVWFFGSIVFMLDCALVALIHSGRDDLTMESGQGYEDIGVIMDNYGERGEEGGGNTFEGDFPTRPHQTLSGNGTTLQV